MSNKLTKASFKKELSKETTLDGLNLRMKQLSNEFPMYAVKIIEAAGEVMAEMAGL